MDLDSFVVHYERLVTQLVNLNTRVLMLGLLPVGEQFPDSAAYFESVNHRLQDIAANRGAEFCDRANQVKLNGYDKLFYRDTFHPNADGAKTLAKILRRHLTNPLNK